MHASAPAYLTPTPTPTAPVPAQDEEHEELKEQSDVAA